MLHLLRDLGLPETMRDEDGVERIAVDLRGDKRHEEASPRSDRIEANPPVLPAPR